MYCVEVEGKSVYMLVLMYYQNMLVWRLKDWQIGKQKKKRMTKWSEKIYFGHTILINPPQKKLYMKVT